MSICGKEHIELIEKNFLITMKYVKEEYLAEIKKLNEQLAAKDEELKKVR